MKIPKVNDKALYTGEAREVVKFRNLCLHLHHYTLVNPLLPHLCQVLFILFITAIPSLLGRFVPVMYLHCHKTVSIGPVTQGRTVLLQFYAFNRTILSVTVSLTLNYVIKGISCFPC